MKEVKVLKRTVKLWVSVILMMALFAGCSVLGTSSREISNIMNSESTEEENNEENFLADYGNEFDLLKNELIKFFRQFFSVSEEEILVLNAYPKKLNDEYWNEYALIKEYVFKLLKGYMAPELEEKFENQFLTTNIHFPRFIEVNGKVIIKYLDVEDVNYEIIEEDKPRYTLLTDVIVKGEVISKEKFIQLYNYNAEKNYYTRKENKSILEESDQDEIKVKCAYILELVNKDEKVSLMSLKENGEIYISEENRRNILNNDFLQRVPYLESPQVSDEALIKLFFNQFMNQDKDSYQYFQYAYDTGYNMFEQMLSDLDLKDYVMLEKGKYKEQFPKTTIPAKDDIISISMNKEDIKVSVHPDTSRKIRKYFADFPAKVRLSDYTNSDIIYRYLVVIEDQGEQGAKIKGIQYLFMDSNTSFIEIKSNENAENAEEN
ncbi:hypothetical protein [Defluviitalea raffinosedens]|uniref:hypothetical protein n=1 Tax=Defluviitalea raffinosedens TaxID=1450156 RepID=UPI00175F9342|nr:hypothetical protein [Defluviitalea raffinosedens]MBM7685547.1 hypothetical protein [Defluviitalea raffinosedens]HHW66724.1 hypothetical protein [Candidatus Epulonipiscium sp.]